MAKSLAPGEALGLLDDPKPKVRVKAIRALATAGDRSVVPMLVSRLYTEHDPKVVDAILSAAHSLGGEEVPAALAYGLRERDQGRFSRASYVNWLGEYPNDPSALGALIAALDDDSLLVRQPAGVALSHFDDPLAAEAVSKAFVSGTLQHAGKAPAPVSVARTLDLFTGEPAVRQAFDALLEPGDRIVIALRIGSKLDMFGGIVALEEELLVAVRQPNKFGLTTRKVNVSGRYPYGEIAYRDGTPGIIFEFGEDTVAFNLSTTEAPQWKPHLTEIVRRIEEAREGHPQEPDRR